MRYIAWIPYYICDFADPDPFRKCATELLILVENIPTPVGCPPDRNRRGMCILMILKRDIIRYLDRAESIGVISHVSGGPLTVGRNRCLYIAYLVRFCSLGHSAAPCTFVSYRHCNVASCARRLISLQVRNDVYRSRAVLAAGRFGARCRIHIGDTSPLCLGRYRSLCCLVSPLFEFSVSRFSKVPSFLSRILRDPSGPCESSLLSIFPPLVGSGGNKGGAKRGYRSILLFSPNFSFSSSRLRLSSPIHYHFPLYGFRNDLVRSWPTQTPFRPNRSLLFRTVFFLPLLAHLSHSQYGDRQNLAGILSAVPDYLRQIGGEVEYLVSTNVSKSSEGPDRRVLRLWAG